MSLSKKAAVRNWAKRRVREAFQEELRSRGWSVDGQVLEGLGHTERRGVRKLGGALNLRVGQGVLGVDGEGVRGECGRVLERVVLERERKRGSGGESGKVKATGEKKGRGKESGLGKDTAAGLEKDPIDALMRDEEV